ncbi:MAG: phosphate ABC transporter permease subunit PstC [Bacteroidales bacterium]|jgi:phosphate transport system permease protein|nr:phosphate ABC transporter permease subunit PstC [Bacteroidales bacterium]
MKKFLEKFIEAIIKTSGGITSIIVLLIVAFLFSEGAGLFNKNKIEEGYTIIVSQTNNVKTFTSNQLKDIFDENITSWKTLNGKDKPIKVYHSIDDFMENEDNKEDAIALVPKEYVKECKGMREVDCGKINFKDFFLGKDWMPTATPASQFGLLPIITGTLWVSFGAILLALPLGLAVAIFLSELATKRIHKILKPTIELLSGIPSVVYGFFGLVVIVPLIQKMFSLDVGETALAGSIVLAIMALPTIITISEDAMRSCPRSMKEASLALGANKWQTICKVVIPYSISGITAAVVLGIGRAIGETMAVLMVTGNSAIIPHSFLEPVRTIPATIAAELGEVPNGSAHYQALFVLGGILFIITLLINLVVDYVTNKNKLKA